MRDAAFAGALAFVACAPQVVDAVDPVGTGGTTFAGQGGSGIISGGSAGRGGTTPRGGGGGTGANGGSGASVGSTGGSFGATGGTGASDGGTGEGGAPGATGCAALGTAGLDLATCEALVGSLVHRYTFDGAGTAVTDAWGGPSGKVVNSTLTGDGAVTLAGHQSDQYVDLPNGIVSALDSATFEVWLTWMGGNEWQRIFDFGNDQSGIEGGQASGDSYLFLTPRLPDGGDALLRVAFQRFPGAGGGEARVDATRTLPANRLTQVAVTFDAATTTIAVYIDAMFENAKAFDPAYVSLRSIKDVNNWLGRSQYGADPELNATIEEFRIYSRALNMDELQASFEAGPSPRFLEGL